MLVHEKIKLSDYIPVSITYQYLFTNDASIKYDCFLCTNVAYDFKLYYPYEYVYKMLIFFN